MTPVARWSRTIEQTVALTVRQPWAWLIVHGFKDIENRPRRLVTFPKPILVHAGSNRNALEENILEVRRNFRVPIPDPDDLEFGGIVGAVDIVACTETSRSKWHDEGSFGWGLANPRRLKFRGCPGAQGFFHPIFCDNAK
ncbi:MAG: Uncharacterized protein FD160_1726 [Caulobacteraceae bacterium]|nr:MAG: Uncharacterized protein FD160_1726 [Caulobacteraceae bacterium]